MEKITWHALHQPLTFTSMTFCLSWCKNLSSLICDWSPSVFLAIKFQRFKWGSGLETGLGLDLVLPQPHLDWASCVSWSSDQSSERGHSRKKSSTMFQCLCLTVRPLASLSLFWNILTVPFSSAAISHSFWRSLDVILQLLSDIWMRWL